MDKHGMILMADKTHHSDRVFKIIYEFLIVSARAAEDQSLAIVVFVLNRHPEMK